VIPFRWPVVSPRHAKNAGHGRSLSCRAVHSAKRAAHRAPRMRRPPRCSCSPATRAQLGFGDSCTKSWQCAVPKRSTKDEPQVRSPSWSHNRTLDFSRRQLTAPPQLLESPRTRCVPHLIIRSEMGTQRDSVAFSGRYQWPLCRYLGS
jgi:hypothetical protein